MNPVIEKFKSDKNLALIGVSANKQKFGNTLLRELTKKGYTIYPVHPSLAEIDGIKCWPDLKSLPENVTNLLLVVRPESTVEIVAELKETHIRRVWMHRGAGKGSASPAAIEQCKTVGIEVVYGLCPMMFLATTGMHRFHYWLREKLGGVPEEFLK